MIHLHGKYCTCHGCDQRRYRRHLLRVGAIVVLMLAGLAFMAAR